MDFRYPIGRFQYDGLMTEARRAECLRVIAETPQRLREAVEGLTDTQLDTPYREGGWTVRQVAHHVPDSHLNAYVRTKLALTETNPTIKPYIEQKWAELADSRGPVAPSLQLLESVHTRWLDILRSLSPADFERPFVHPQYGDKTFSIDWLVALYAWHGPHHIAHITGLRERSGW